MSIRHPVVFLLILSLLPALGPTPGARAGTTIAVTVAADDLPVNRNCTLCQAIHTANTGRTVEPCAAGYGCDTIVLPSRTCTSGGRFAGTGEASSTDRLLVPRQDHAGPAPSFARLSGDRPIEAGGGNAALVAERSGFPRPGEGDLGSHPTRDIGAHAFRSTTVHLPLVLNDHFVPAYGRGPGGAVHLVQRDETLASVARRYGTTVSAIMRANGLSNPDFIWVGQRLHIPSGYDALGTNPSSDGIAARMADRWIEVVLSSQRTIAWQGDQHVRTMVVSTGIPQYPTPTGRFRIYAKYPSVTMSGPDYRLPGVPDTMFFHRGCAIHGTYWHNNFGHPMSHGCVNLAQADAEWLYGWVPLGTLVVVRD